LKMSYTDMHVHLLLVFCRCESVQTSSVEKEHLEKKVKPAELIRTQYEQ
jgi:hypothetical protein